MYLNASHLPARIMPSSLRELVLSWRSRLAGGADDLIFHIAEEDCKSGGVGQMNPYARKQNS
jgi:hypothetical protein